MSLYDNGNSNGLIMPVAPMYGNGYGNGFGGDGAWWLIILLLVAFGNNGFGNGFGGGNNFVPFMMNNQNDVQRGFDQQAIIAELNGIAASLANAEVSRCNTQANLLQTLNNNQNATTAAMNSLAMSLQSCCCENRAQTAELESALRTEAAATRAATQAQTQTIMDKLCQLELDGIKQNYENRISGMQNTIDTLRAQVASAADAASQTAQTARILADNAAQTQMLEQYLNPAPIPAYVVQNPNCCNNFYNGCGCGN